MQSDPVLVAETRSWLVRASNDLAAAAHNMTAQPPFVGDAVFHAQQATEKALKGFLIWHRQTIRKTHSLVKLGQECSQLDTSLQTLLSRAAPLTEYAWKFRYPGQSTEPSSEEAEDAMAIARQVYDAILNRLPTEAHP